MGRVTVPVGAGSGCEAGAGRVRTRGTTPCVVWGRTVCIVLGSSPLSRRVESVVVAPLHKICELSLHLFCPITSSVEVEGRRAHSDRTVPRHGGRSGRRQTCSPPQKQIPVRHTTPETAQTMTLKDRDNKRRGHSARLWVLKITGKIFPKCRGVDEVSDRARAPTLTSIPFVRPAALSLSGTRVGVPEPILLHLLPTRSLQRRLSRPSGPHI